MVGFSLHISAAPGSLTVSIPANLLLVLTLLLPLPILLKVRSLTKTPRGRRSSLFLILLNIVLIGVTFTPAKLILNAQEGTAQIHTMFLFYPRHRVIPLSSVKGAIVKTSDLSDALVVVLNNGRGLQLTPFDQVHGNDEAASAINDFLRAHGGSGNPDGD